MGFAGTQIYRQAPPIPTFRVQNSTTVFTSEDILDGQQVWQSIGGQQMGSVWGHGALQAPDWTADWLHREAVKTKKHMGQQQDAHFVAAMRKNSYDASTGEACLSLPRAHAIEAVKDYYVMLFTGAAMLPEADEAFSVSDLPRNKDLMWLRSAYSMKDVTLLNHTKAAKLAAFIFWSSWAASTERPGLAISYTSNWPMEPLVGNAPAADVIVWSVASLALLVGGIGIVGSLRAAPDQAHPECPREDPLISLVVTPSMHSIRKWVWLVFALGFFQIAMGVYIAHISVDPDSNSPVALPDWLTQNLTYTVARTWHVQTAVFFTVVGFLGAGLFLAPVIGGLDADPPFQHILADLLFVCLLVIVVGSYGGQLAAVHQLFDSMRMSQWFGHQGYEYIELGRFWQLFLMAGLVLWLGLMFNGAWPALRKRTGTGGSSAWHISVMLLVSFFLIVFFYSAGFMYSARTHLSIVEFWRFQIVHIWVEAVLEVFATVIIAYLFVKLGLITAEAAAGASLFAASVFLFGGIPGMFHHNYWAGTPTLIMAIGSVFSALEVVPLALVGFDVADYMRVKTESINTDGFWLRKYKPIIDCLLCVAFWNFVGAGILGFVINPPISLYYLQGTYLVQAHSHGALWGVYGMLSIALCLMVLRLQDLNAKWRTRTLSWGLWLMNIGMFLQIFLSLLPIGFYQFWSSVHRGYWFARSHHFHQQPIVQWLKLSRGIGDATFAFGILLMCSFLFSLGRASLKSGAPRLESDLNRALLGRHNAGIRC